MKVLLADDDSISRAVLKNILKAEPAWEIVEAQDGLIAWDLLHSGLNPAMCLIDIRMPGLDGTELVQKIRSNSRLRELPVVIISSVRDRNTILTLTNLGISGYLMKPYAAVKVLETLRRAIKTSMSKSLSSPLDAIQRLNMSPGRYLRLLAQLIAQSQESLEEIRKAWMSGDTSTAAGTLDSIATASLSLGAEELARVATETAKALWLPEGPTCDLSDIEGALDALRGTFETVKTELRESSRV